MLIAEEVVVRYPRFILGPLSLQLRASERVALLGRNGAGKSTLLALLAGQRVADSGVVSLADATGATPGDVPRNTSGIDRDEGGERLRLRRHVAYVGAGLQSLPWYTVRQHFDFLGRIHERWNAPRAMDLARSLRLDLDATTGTLSRGNLVKLNLCAGWGQEASVLLLDEPTAGLDPVSRADMLEELQLFIDGHASATVVYATHLLDELRTLQPQRLLVLADGNMREYDQRETAGFDIEVMTALMQGHRHGNRHGNGHGHVSPTQPVEAA